MNRGHFNNFASCPNDLANVEYNSAEDKSKSSLTRNISLYAHSSRYITVTHVIQLLWESRI